jgi:hypothetical protein
MPMTTVRILIRVCTLVAALIPLGACRHLGSPEVAPGTTYYPEKNTYPSRQVSIRGMIAPTLTITLSAMYRGKVAADCYKTAIFSGEIFEGTTSPLQVTVPIPVSREDNKFSASFEVDRFVPGKCGWHLAAVVVQISNGNYSFGPATILQPPDYRNGESKALNSSDDPVILSCRDLGKEAGYSCKPPFPSKSSQILVDTTSVVNVKITDDDAK